MSPAEITVTLPADSRFIALARVTTTSLAAELDFSVDDIDDLRVGADELVAVLIEWAEDNGAATIELRFGVDTDELTLEGRVDSGAPLDVLEPVDDLARRILAAVVDDHELGEGHGRIVKRRTES